MDSLPHELLHSIIEYIAYIPVLTFAYDFKSRFERVSPALRALSKANVQSRQACLPFLFANIKIRHDRDARKLRKYVTLFSRYTKLLFIDSNSSDNIGDPIVAQIVPQLKHLLHVEMPGRTWDKPVLLRAILSHPTVITVRVSGLLPKSNDDFSKVIFDHRNLWNPETDFFEQRLINGMKLSRLEIHSPHLLDTMPVDFGSRIFPGLEQIQFRMAQHCVSFSWLAALSSTHPHLNEFWLYDPGRCYFPRHVPPFISTFDEDSRHQGLKKDFFVTRVGLRRNINRPSEQDWYVFGFTFRTTSSSTSLIKILALVASSFPKLEILGLDLSAHNGMYDADELASALVHFPLLRVVYLSNVHRRLKEGAGYELCKLQVPKEGSDLVLSPRISHVERATFQLMFCLAKRVRTLDSFRIDSNGYDNESSRSGTKWSLKGWRHVVNSNRAVGGLRLKRAIVSLY